MRSWDWDLLNWWPPKLKRSFAGVKVSTDGPRGKVLLVPPRKERETLEELGKRSVVVTNLEVPEPKKRRAPRGTFDRKAYQREYMRRKRKKERS